MRSRLTRALFGLALTILPGLELAAQNDAPSFAFSFSPCPQQVNVLAGQRFQRAFACVLTTTSNPDPLQGAQGWSLSLSADGVEFTSATTHNTVAARTTATPPGLNDGGFEKTELARQRGSGDCEGREGVISAVVLSFVNVVTLPPSGSAIVCRFTVQGQAPELAGSAAAVRLFYVNGCGGSG